MPDTPFACNLFPDNALIAVSGDDAAAFLHGQFTNDVLALKPGEAHWNGWCSPKGRLLATFVLARGKEGYFLMLPMALREAFQKRLLMFVLRSKVKLENFSATVSHFGVWGGALPEGAFALGADHGVVIDGAAPTGRAAGFAAWSLALIRAGILVVVPETQDQFVPQMANFELIGGVNFKKGCYPGQEIVARMQYRGGLKRRMVRVASGVACEPGTSVYSSTFGEQSAGMVANVAPSTEGGWEALVVAQLEAIAIDDLKLASPQGTPLEILPLPYAIK
jgi:folate-binding protein YgfZ